MALEEDFGRGDVTSEAIFDADAPARGVLQAKGDLVLAGMEVAEAVFRRVEPAVRFTARRRDGERLAPGEVAAEIAGTARGLLAAERTALNFLQRLSGT